MNYRWMCETISQILNGKFFGKLTISFENGKIVSVKKEESLRPE
jgi:hypothetical protein